jgi:hypothetical protein
VDEPSWREEARAHAGILAEASGEVLVAFPIDRLVAELDGLRGVAASELMPAPAVRRIAAARARYGIPAAGSYAKLVVWTLIQDLPNRLARLPLPASIREVYPATLRRIASRLAIVPDDAYVAELGDFWRDLRLASQLAVPLTASRVLDRVAFLPASFYRNMGPRENLRCLRFLAFRLHGLGPLFRVHIDERDLSEFNDAGWDRAYQRAAEMLRLYPESLGTVGTAWTLDPALDLISTHLTYTRRCQTDQGAFLRNEGPSELTTRRALAASRTRRLAYERGEYVPTTYSAVWARRDHLRWAAAKANV